MRSDRPTIDSMLDNVNLAGWLNRLSDSTGGLLFWVFVVVLVIAFISFVARWVLGFIAAKLEKTENFWDDALFAALRWPVPALIWVLGLSWLAKFIYHETKALIFADVAAVRDVAVIVIFTWFVISFVTNVEQFFKEHQPVRSRLDRTSIEAIARVVRTAILITAVLMTLQKLGYDITGILAMGSIGGIAISFAARDMIANFFGGMMVYLDRPFSVGDWIRSPDREIEGTVEHIGWRVTRIRTFDQRPLYVPNAYFTTISVENPSRMHNRRIFETIGVRYEDFAVLPAIVDEVREMLENHPEIDTSRTLMANFDAFADSSLNFFVYTFTRTRVWTEYHAVKQEVLLKIGEIIERHGASIAFPTRTLHWPDELLLAVSQRQSAGRNGDRAETTNDDGDDKKGGDASSRRAAD